MTSTDAVATAEATPDNRGGRLGYRPALDGLRGFAVLAIMLYHGNVWWAKGTFFSVDLFFGLSGYLITTLLLIEHDESGRIDMKEFWRRRARRLLPALLLVLVAVAFYAAFVVEPAEAAKIRRDGIATMFYSANWNFIFGGESYFDAFTTPSPLRHAWTLAIEEQWYLIWPLVLLVGLRYSKNPKHWLIAIGGLTLASAAWMGFLYTPGEDPTRVYYGTDTRAQSLLIGAGLAFVLRHRPTASEGEQKTLIGLGVAGTAVMMFMMFSQLADPESSSWVYRGGFLLFGIAAAATIAGTLQPDPNPLSRIWSIPPLPWCGRLSYGLYLWHWPIYIYLTPERTGLDGDALLFFRLAVTFVVSSLSYYFVEVPIRNRKIQLGSVKLLTGLAIVATLALILMSAAPGGQSGEVSASTVDVPPKQGDLKVMIVGDSVAVSLAAGFSPSIDASMNVVNRANLGCGVTQLVALPNGGARRVDFSNCPDWRATWAEQVADYAPDVVIVLVGGWEVYDQERDGEVISVGSDAYRAYLLAQLDDAIGVLSATGARVVLLTPPCYEAQDKPGSRAPVERVDVRRSAWVSGVIAEAANARPGKADLLDLRTHVCASGEHEDELNGVTLYKDGVHFDEPGAAEVWRWLAPLVRQSAGAADGAGKGP